MDLRELGEMLRQRREETGLTFDEIVERTKISRRNLQSIEEARRDELPHAVYSKGFIRNYASVLGADMRVVNKALAEIFPEEEDSEDAIAEVQRDLRLHRADGRGMRLFKAGVLLALLVSAVIAVILMLPGRKERGANGQPSAAPAVSAPAEAVRPKGEAKPAEKPLETPKPAEAPKPEEKPVPAPAPEEQSKPAAQAPVQVPAPSAPAPSVAAAAPAETAAPAPVQEPAPKIAPGSVEQAAPALAKAGSVQIVAKEACWLEAVPGGGEAQEFFLRPGEKLTIDYASSLELRVGNGGGISVTHNGKPVKIDARSGEVKTLTFP